MIVLKVTKCLDTEFISDFPDMELTEVEYDKMFPIRMDIQSEKAVRELLEDNIIAGIELDEFKLSFLLKEK